MSIELTLHTPSEVPLETEVIRPDKMAGLSESKIAALPVQHGNRQVKLGEFFKVSGSGGDEIRLHGDLSRVKLIGAGMTSGRIVVGGNVGQHLGTGMSGGEILVNGDADDWVGPEMTGGRIVIKGNAGHAVGGAYRGAQVSVQGGEIIVFGNAGNEIGSTMRSGLIAIGGDCGDFTGINMLSGTIIALGKLGWRSGANMRRGTIVSMENAELLPTFSYACTYNPAFLRLYLLHLQELGLPVSDAQITGKYKRWSGDSVAMNRGEILIFEG